MCAQRNDSVVQLRLPYHRTLCEPLGSFEAALRASPTTKKRILSDELVEVTGMSTAAALAERLSAHFGPRPVAPAGTDGNKLLEKVQAEFAASVRAGDARGRLLDFLMSHPDRFSLEVVAMDECAAAAVASDADRLLLHVTVSLRPCAFNSGSREILAGVQSLLDAIAPPLQERVADELAAPHLPLKRTAIIKEVPSESRARTPAGPCRCPARVER